MTKAALYARVSTDDQDPALQLDALRTLARQRGWETEEFTDQGWSGAKDRRPGLDAMMARMRAGAFHVVAVWKFDRFARSVTHLLEAAGEFEARRVDFVSVTEQIDTSTPMGKAVFTILGAVAQLERDILRERTRAGMATAKAKGKHVGRPKVEFDLRPALAMLDAGHGLGVTANALRVKKTTLRRRLTEAGEWPRPKGEE